MGRSTINQKSEKYIQLRSDIDDLLEALGDRAVKQLELSNKSSIIEELEANLKFKDKVIQQQERDVIKLRREADEAKRSLGEERDERQREVTEFRRLIAELEAEKALLTAKIRGVESLKRVKT